MSFCPCFYRNIAENGHACKSSWYQAVSLLPHSLGYVAITHIFTAKYSVSLVPRLPHLGTQTLKLCRRGEPGIFSNVRSGKAELNCVWVYSWHRTGKRAKVAGNLLHISSYWTSNNIHTECWSIVGWTMHKTLPFCFDPILITSCLCRKDTRLSLWYIFAFQESLGTRTQSFATSVMIYHCRGASLSEQPNDLLICHCTKQGLSHTSIYLGIT